MTIAAVEMTEGVVTPDQLTPMGRAALWYARRGWAVFPLAPRSKIPAIAGGRGCLDATTDVALIARWWTETPARNVGLATGKHFWVLDIDKRSGGDVALDQLEAEHGALPETVEALTGGGGRHILFRMEPALVGITWPAHIAPGVDVKGGHGYIAAPPSIHPNGTPYVWEATHTPWQVALADPPAWLVAMLTRGSSCVAGETISARPPDYWRDLVTAGVNEGGRNHAVAKVAGYLLRRVDPFVALELVLGWNARRCRPPLPESEVIKVVDSIARKEARRRRAAA